MSVVGIGRTNRVACTPYTPTVTTVTHTQGSVGEGWGVAAHDKRVVDGPQQEDRRDGGEDGDDAAETFVLLDQTLQHARRQSEVRELGE